MLRIRGFCRRPLWLQRPRPLTVYGQIRHKHLRRGLRHKRSSARSSIAGSCSRCGVRHNRSSARSSIAGPCSRVGGRHKRSSARSYIREGNTHLRPNRPWRSPRVKTKLLCCQIQVLGAGVVATSIRSKIPRIAKRSAYRNGSERITLADQTNQGRLYNRTRRCLGHDIHNPLRTTRYRDSWDCSTSGNGSDRARVM